MALKRHITVTTRYEPCLVGLPLALKTNEAVDNDSRANHVQYVPRDILIALSNRLRLSSLLPPGAPADPCPVFVV